jgi:hypothetical protein
MNNNHQIESALFEVTYGQAGFDTELRSEVDDFIKTHALSVIEDVFNETCRADKVIRIPGLVLDLGDILYSNYKSDLPRLLREKLVDELRDLHIPENSGNSTDHHIASKRVVNKTIADAQELFYFLLNGYMPWYSKNTSSNSLDILLNRTINQHEELLINFLRNNAQNNIVIDRLHNQFSNNYTKSINRLLNENVTENSSKKNSSVDKSHHKFVTALVSGDSQTVVLCWNSLYKNTPSRLRHLVRKYAQKIKVRQHLLSALSKTGLGELLSLLEPVHSDFIDTLITHPELFNTPDSNTCFDRAEQQSCLWMLSLECLLIEHAHGFSRKEFLLSLLKRLAAVRGLAAPSLLKTFFNNISKHSQSSKLTHDLVQASLNAESDVNVYLPDDSLLYDRLIQDRNEQLDLHAAYECYEHLVTAFTVGFIHLEMNKSSLLNDIDFLAHKEPWVLMRLSRELHSGTQTWQSVIGTFSMALLRRLVDTLLLVTTKLEKQYKTELTKAINLNVDKSANKKSIYIYLLKCLINQDNIDFDIIAATVAADKYSHTNTTPLDSLPDTDVLGKNADNTFIEALTKEKSLHLFFDMLTSDVEITDHTKIKINILFTHLYSQCPTMLHHQVIQHLDDGLFTVNLSKCLPESSQLKLLSILSITEYPRMLKITELINTACQTTGITIKENSFAVIKWQFIYNYVAESGSFFNDVTFTSMYVETILSQVNAPHPDAVFANTHANEINQFIPVLSKALRQNTLLSTTKLTQDILQALRFKVTHTADEADRFDKTVETDVYPAQKNSIDIESDENTSDDLKLADDIHIDNSGIVLAAVYLPRLFNQLGLIKDSAFINRSAAERAVHVTQYLVNEQSTSPEFRLVINKILCGIKPASPICRAADLSDDDKDQLENLLSAMIQHWKALGKTSINGFRQSFMQRHGRLQFNNDNWHLLVEPKAFDMLLDSIPWSYTTIKFPWMDHIMYVEWR